MASSSTKSAAGEAALKGVALVKAAELGKINEVAKLLNKKADINYSHRFMSDGIEHGRTPLSAAVVVGNAEVVKFLITRKANVDLAEDVGGETALHCAAVVGNVSMIELLMSKGARHDVRSKFECTPLHSAAYHGRKDAVASLLDHGADINVQDNTGETPLMAARFGNHQFLDVVDILLLRGADLNLTNTDGATALSLATSEGRLEVAKRLSDVATGTSRAGSRGGTSFSSSAADHGHLENDKYLAEEKGAGISDDYQDKTTALYYAAFHGRLDVVKSALGLQG